MEPRKSFRLDTKKGLEALVDMREIEIKGLEKELAEFKEGLRNFICEEESWLEENGGNLMAFAVSIGVGKYEPYDPEKHTTFLADEWGVEKGDKIWWFGKDE